jgi:hypothetical protein
MTQQQLKKGQRSGTRRKYGGRRIYFGDGLPPWHRQVE